MAAALVLCGCGRAADPHDAAFGKVFAQDVRLGMRLSQVRERVPGVAFAPYAGYLDTLQPLPYGMKQRLLRFGDAGEEFQSRDPGRLEFVSLSADSVDARALLAQLMREFGPPDARGCSHQVVDVHVWKGRRTGVYMTSLARTKTRSHVQLAYHRVSWEDVLNPAPLDSPCDHSREPR